MYGIPLHWENTYGPQIRTCHKLLLRRKINHPVPKTTNSLPFNTYYSPGYSLNTELAGPTAGMDALENRRNLAQGENCKPTKWYEWKCDSQTSFQNSVRLLRRGGLWEYHQRPYILRVHTTRALPWLFYTELQQYHLQQCRRLRMPCASKIAT